jgi:hypothetical protein
MNCMFCGKPLPSEPFLPVSEEPTIQEAIREDKGGQTLT